VTRFDAVRRVRGAAAALVTLVLLTALAGIPAAAPAARGASPARRRAGPARNGPAPTRKTAARADSTARPLTVITGPTETVLTRPELAREALVLEDAGVYRLAARQLGFLRRASDPDPDLDLELALDLARSGSLDSARALLHEPRLDAALADSCPPARRRPYGWTRDRTWLNGRFDGWRWYIARARTEVDAVLGRWPEARQAARRAVEDRPLAGKEWLIAALCAGHSGDPAAAEFEARMAAGLDPMLPEAQYVVGLFDWSRGDRSEALRRFGAALALDSLYEPAVRSRQRLRFFPGARPDSLPVELLTGDRRAGLLTSPVGPKIESQPSVERQAAILSRMMVPVPDSIEIEMKPLRFVLPVLVDARGRAVLNDLPWFPQGDLPAPFVSVLLESLPGWRFSPAMKSGAPVASWSGVSITTGSSAPPR